MLWNTIAWLPIAWTLLSGASVSEWWIIFNWFNLLDCWELATQWNYDDINWIQLDTYNAPRTDWGGKLWYYINWKSIVFDMIIKEDTEEELNSQIDLLKKKLAKEDWLLEININWEYRVWTAYLTSLTFNRDFEKKTIQNNVQATFTLLNHLYSSEWDAISQLWITSNSLAMDIDNNGTTECFFKTAIVFGAGNSWVTDISIVKDWYTLEVTNTFNDWDLLVIDWVNKEVLLNTVAIDYNGAFKELETWSNPFTININWTVNVDITVLFNKNYL